MKVITQYGTRYTSISVGVMTMASGTIYKGEFKANRRCGQGMLKIRSSHSKGNGDIYTGAFADDHFDGFGVLELADGSSYAGYFSRSVYHGTGTWKDIDGISYAGEWLQGAKHGNFVITDRNGQTHTQEYRNGKTRAEWFSGVIDDQNRKQGYGSTIADNGDSFTGEIVIPYCQLTCVILSFVGYFVDDQMHGFGEMVYCLNETGMGSLLQSYTGQWERSHMEGKGIAVFRDGTTFEGTFKHNQRHGMGTIKYTDGSTFTGRFENNIIVGTGTFQRRTNFSETEYAIDVFEGDWSLSTAAVDEAKLASNADDPVRSPDALPMYMDLRSYVGQGVITYATGDLYEGRWESLECNGYGKQRFTVEKIVYRGDCKDGLFHGHGDLELADGTVYLGSFMYGKKHGKGVEKYPDGGTYEGDFADGVRSGVGRFHYSDGSIYDGEWANHMRNGFGELKHTNGNHYKGSWKDGNRHDQGMMLYSDGSSYEGQWQYDQKSGQGIYKMSNGDVFEGLFQHNQMVKGRYEFAKGNVYEGEFHDKKREGKGTITYSNNDVYTGTWKNGKKDGRGHFVSGNGSIDYEGEFEDNEISGAGVMKLSSGETYVGIFLKGMREKEVSRSRNKAIYSTSSFKISYNVTHV